MEDCENTPKEESPIDAALKHLSNNIDKLKEMLPKFESILASVLTESEKRDSPDTTREAGQTSLEERLILMKDSVQDINGYLMLLQNRIQL